MKLPVYQLPSLSADQVAFLNSILAHIIHAVNNLEFGDASGNENIWCTFVTVDACSANEVASASHELRRKPSGTMAVWQDAGGVLYKPTDATSADTTTQVFYTFSTDVPSAVLLLI